MANMRPRSIQYQYDDESFGGYGAPGFRIPVQHRKFDEYFRCYPVAFMPGPERSNVNYGGKIFLPPSALEKLTRLHITYPMLFSLHNGKKRTVTHAGVLEFIAEEGRVYLPQWMMTVLLLEPGDLLQLKSCDLPPGNFLKLQPQSPEFLEISDPKAVLENVLRNFSALTVGDIFSFEYNDSVFEIAVLEVKPTGGGAAVQGEEAKSAIGCVEVDLEVDFAPPVGYVEPDYKGEALKKAKEAAAKLAASGGIVHTAGTMAKQIGYDASKIQPSTGEDDGKPPSRFVEGGGRKLGGKKTAAVVTSAPAKVEVPKVLTGLEPLRLPHGTLFFGFKHVPVKKKDEGEAGDDEGKGSGFVGEGRALKKKSKK
ncbi:ubiquitin fusion degradation protein Ufd1 [Ascobolus immersus RN42]|uniref:Ubiquitin fusion degradation protein 1 n=1 Tax=Ascobolus immersus RN42 TaxID=1160509 RepID=A0A3N4IKY9_ASCIM|nr:ubiquitin fusion degradation protein Ufd1 [Ascobolus immersus RN42]